MAYDSTTVPVSKSQETIRTILQNFDASGFGFGEETVGNITYALISFRIHNLSVRMRVALKAPSDQDLAARARRSRTKTTAQLRQESLEQEARRIWRVLAWNIKARMEAVQEGVETFESAWLSHLVIDPSGATVYERLRDDRRLELPDALPQLPA